MATAPEALDLIREFEGYLREVGGGMVAPYLCPAHVATIGWGSIHYEDGRRVKLSDPPIDKVRAAELLMHEVGRICEPAIARLVTVPLHPLMHGALVSFAFNVGVGALQSSTLLKRVNARDWDDVPRQFAKWNHGGGRELRGLTRRRKDEAAMFMRGVEALARGDTTVAASVVVVNSPVDVPVRRVSAWRAFLNRIFRRS